MKVEDSVLHGLFAFTCRSVLASFRGFLPPLCFSVHAKVNGHLLKDGLGSGRERYFITFDPYVFKVHMHILNLTFIAKTRTYILSLPGCSSSL